GTLIKNVENEINVLEQSLAGFRPVGILLGKADEIKLAEGARQGTLWVIWSDAEGPASFKKIGVASRGKVVLDSKAVTLYPQGSLLYLRKD
ncbi:unnamed protein product, partial [marine sediment metagenome]